jgi:hypothetical protein
VGFVCRGMESTLIIGLFGACGDATTRYPTPAPMVPKTDFSKWDAVPEAAPDQAVHRVVILAQLRDNATGELRVYKTSGYFFAEDILVNQQHPNTFTWEDGNNSCDCNRRTFFIRANGEACEDNDYEVACTDGNFSANLINPRTGVCYYREFETPDTV